MLPNHLIPPIRLPGTAAVDDTLAVGAGHRLFNGHRFRKRRQAETPSPPLTKVPGSLPRRRKGLGVVLEYANRSGSPIWTIPPESNWSYLLFGGQQVSSKPEEEIAMVIDRAHPDKFGMEQWSINGEIYQDGRTTHQVKQGRHYRLVLKNQTEEAHPLHLHRSRFQLSHVNRVPTGGILKDAVVLKGYQTVAIDFIADQPGLSLFHCHQQQHMDAGFKSLFSIA
jgi:FtsP/CotA-like multicopper oxidase with cupredoxin domain